MFSLIDRRKLIAKLGAAASEQNILGYEICYVTSNGGIMLRIIIKKLLSLPFRMTMLFNKVYETILATVTSKAFAGEWRDKFTLELNNLKREVSHISNQGHEFRARFYTPNNLCEFRADTFSTKEPEILRWIDDYGDEGIFCDVGANVGLYSIYFAKTKPGLVYSFEPSVFNLPILAKNISENGVSDKVTLISNPLSLENGINRFMYSSVDEGAALNAFGVEYGHDGENLNDTMSVHKLGFSLDYLVENKIVSDVPKMIKIDVDGIEHLILKGAETTLRNVKCQSVYVEVNDDFERLADEIQKILKSCGFELKEKTHSEFIDFAPQFQATFNQIWIKKNI